MPTVVTRLGEVASGDVWRSRRWRAARCGGVCVAWTSEVRTAPQRCRLKGGLAKVLQQRLFPFEVGSLRQARLRLQGPVAQVLLDHLERIFDLALVYHDFYAGALSEHTGPLQKRAALVKQLSEFVIGEEGDAEGYAYPQDPSEQLPEGGISPTSTLELVGNFFYHAHGREQCEAHRCGSLVPVLRLNRVAPLNMLKAFCDWLAIDF